MERNKQMKNVPQNDEQLRQAVSARYARTALQVLGASLEESASGSGSGCCGQPSMTEPQPASVEASSSSCCASSCCTSAEDQGDPITSDLYTQMELGQIPV